MLLIVHTFQQVNIEHRNKDMTTLKVGDAAPQFSAKDQDGNVHELSDYKGKKLVVFFYPKASTPGCTAEACNLRDNWEVFQEKGYEILGVSADSAKRQTNFKNKHELPFPLLADEDKEVINAFGVWGPKKFMGKEYDGIHRTTFIIDEEGKIEEVIGKVKTKAHAEQILGE
ncbi:Putative peroxiredoxin bcp [Mesonia oceanica]|uniref:Peroxiredoxin bcp n=1 Tax=Mesonia oceanica TaxID=2687242 RepID=A0AC61Y7F4_9FLAO|nr:Putative peroxiredoxin bcp [Mesonia oceanica]|tara:strand:+ start:26766 stop:27278 length:513 start_codon:yes stop_codon:yes gene_type:complete